MKLSRSIVAGGLAAGGMVLAMASPAFAGDPCDHKHHKHHDHKHHDRHHHHHDHFGHHDFDEFEFEFEDNDFLDLL
jgi:Ni/Co efflux regulator RcnB